MIFQKDILSSAIDRCIAVNRHSKKIIVFPETEDRILLAASILVKRGICHPLILANEDKIRLHLERLKIKNLSSENFYDHLGNENELKEYAKAYLGMRKADGKQVAEEEAMQKLRQPHFYAAMMVHNDLANGMISGIDSRTKPYYPAFEIIKTKEGISRASGLFLMVKGKNVYLFADCALNINPSSKELSQIALTSVQTAISLGIKPKVAMLSFSTHGTAKHEMVEKIKEATELVKKADREIIIDGEIQLDSAIVPEVFSKKCPDSILEGEANVLIFPDLNSGNIGYKLVERLAGYKAIGPIIQGLNKPVNDLSRGASVQDIVDLAAITVLQGM